MTKNKLTGYHGTTRAYAQSILSSGKFRDSKKPYEWLGRGVYFFYYRDDAEWWIHVANAVRYKGQETQILHGLLEYSDEQLADLDNPVELEKLNKLVEEAIRRQKETGKPISAKIHNRQCFACNLLRKMNPEIGIIIYTFSRGRSPGSAGFFLNQKQICVSDHSIIVGIEEEQVNNHVRSQ